jgi:hypothetical protein
MEAMALGRPLITTNWSGPTAFIDETVAYPLAVQGLEPIGKDGGAFFSGQRWAVPSTAHLRRLLRQVVTDRDEAARRGREARKRVVERFSLEAAGRAVLAEVRRIERLLGTGPLDALRALPWEFASNGSDLLGGATAAVPSSAEGAASSSPWRGHYTRRRKPPVLKAAAADASKGLGGGGGGPAVGGGAANGGGASAAASSSSSSSVSSHMQGATGGEPPKGTFCEIYPILCKGASALRGR